MYNLRVHIKSQRSRKHHETLESYPISARFLRIKQPPKFLYFSNAQTTIHTFSKVELYQTNTEVLQEKGQLRQTLQK